MEDGVARRNAKVEVGRHRATFRKTTNDAKYSIATVFEKLRVVVSGVHETCGD
jgi:hypothetical protein